MSDDGVLVLMDLGSALMSAEFAVELLEDPPGRVLLSEAPLVEGAVAAAAAASGGASLDEVAAEARGALAMKSSQLGRRRRRSRADAAGTSAADPGRRCRGVAPRAQRDRAARSAGGAVRRDRARLRRRGLRGEGRRRRAGEAPRSLTNVVALGRSVRRHAAGQRVGATGARGVAALRGAGRRGVRRRRRAAAPRPAPRPPAPGAARPRTPTLTTIPASPDEPSGVLRGVAASAGVAVGPAHHLHGAFAPPPRPVAAGDRERERLVEAIAAAKRAIERDRETVAARAGQAEAAIFDAHLVAARRRGAARAGAARDRGRRDRRARVATTPPARSPSVTARSTSRCLQERAADVLDVGPPRGGRAHRRAPIDGGHESGGSSSPASSRLPTPPRSTPPSSLGIATAHGTATAHAAILARALGLPAVVGLGDTVLEIPEGTTVLLDGEAGTAPGRPAGRRPARGDRAARACRAQRRRAARARAHETGATRDGTRIEVFANLGARSRTRRARSSSAPRASACCAPSSCSSTAPSCPSEEEQAETLREIARRARRAAARRAHARRRRRQAAAGAADAARGQPVPRRARDPALRSSAPGRARHPAARDPARRRRAPDQGDAPDGRDARRDRSRRGPPLDQARADTGIDAPLEFGIMVEVPAAALTAARLGRARRLLLARDERPDPVHDGRRARRRAARAAAHRPPAGRAAPRPGDGRRRRARMAAGSGYAASWPAIRPPRCCSPGWA